MKTLLEQTKEQNLLIDNLKQEVAGQKTMIAELQKVISDNESVVIEKNAEIERLKQDQNTDEYKKLLILVTDKDVEIERLKQTVEDTKKQMQDFEGKVSKAAMEIAAQQGSQPVVDLPEDINASEFQKFDGVKIRRLK